MKSLEYEFINFTKRKNLDFQKSRFRLYIHT